MKISLFYDHVTVLDYAYLDDHLGAVGHSLVVNVEFIGKTDKEGVVYDFSHAKKKVKEIIDRDCDHRLVIPKGLAQRKNGEVSFTYAYGFNEEKIIYRCPEEGVCEIPFAHISEANLLAYLEEQVLKEMPETVEAIKLTFTQEDLGLGHVYFHYTHGLKEHYGNCQRLIHGHRSTVKVFLNGKRDEQFEEFLADDLFSGNIHFCLWENVVNKTEIENALQTKGPEGRFEDLPSVHIKYRSGQGEFEAVLPGRAVYLMQTETTVENLSIHFARVIKAEVASTVNVMVHAFEGIAKGAKTSL